MCTYIRINDDCFKLKNVRNYYMFIYMISLLNFITDVMFSFLFAKLASPNVMLTV